MLFRWLLNKDLKEAREEIPDNKGRALQMGTEEEVFSACLKNGASKGDSRETGEAEGPDAEHRDLHILAKAEAFGGGIGKGVTCLAWAFKGCHLCGALTQLPELGQASTARVIIHLGDNGA